MNFREQSGTSKSTAESRGPSLGEPTAPAPPEPTAPAPGEPAVHAPGEPSRARSAAEPERATAASERSAARIKGRNMLPERERRRFGAERLLVRLVATCGIVAIGVALGAILRSSDVQGWIIGLVVALVSVILSAILWSSRQV